MPKKVTFTRDWWDRNDDGQLVRYPDNSTLVISDAVYSKANKDGAVVAAKPDAKVTTSETVTAPVIEETITEGVEAKK